MLGLVPLFLVFFVLGSNAGTVVYNISCTGCTTDPNYMINGQLLPTISCTVGDTIVFNVIDGTAVDTFPFTLTSYGGLTVVPALSTGSGQTTCDQTWSTNPVVYTSTNPGGFSGKAITVNQPTSIACASDAGWSVTCPEFSQVKVTSASYGRQNSTLCSSGTCSAVTDVTSTLQTLCNSKTHYCGLYPATSTTLSIADPCTDGSSYLSVEWTCVKIASGPLVLAPASQSTTNRLNFLVVGDWGGGDDSSPTSSIQLQVAASMATVATAMKSAFVVSLGDNFYTLGVQSETSTRFQSTWSGVYNTPPLNTLNWYQVTGNHDHYGNVTAQLEFAKLNSRWIFPARNYDWVSAIPGSTRTVLFTQVETYHLTTEAHSTPVDPFAATDALNFFNFSLSYAYSHWRIMLTHYAIVSVSNHGTNPTLVSSLTPLVQKGKYDCVFNGHDHNHQHYTYAGNDYYVIGSGSKTDTTSTNTNSFQALSPAATQKYFHPYSGGSNTLSTCINIGVAVAPFCQFGFVTIDSATYGSGGNNAICNATNCTQNDVSATVKTQCQGKQSCVVSLSSADTSACPAGTLIVNYRCTHANEGGFSAVSIGENDMYVTAYSASGNAVYQVQYQKPISQETAPTPRPPPPPSVAPTPPPVAPGSPPVSVPTGPSTPSTPSVPAPVQIGVPTPEVPGTPEPTGVPSPSGNNAYPTPIGLIVGLSVGLFILALIIIGGIYWWASQSTNWESI